MSQKFYSIRARAKARSAEVLIYSDIGESWFGEFVAAKDFVRDFSALDADQITVRINSFGGSVPDGIAIYNAIKRHPANVTVAIDGIAASIASLIAMAGDTIEMAENSLLMIHAPWGAAAGNALDMRDFADMLDTWSEAMATSYAAQTGKPQEEMLALLTDGVDHFYTAEEALAAGFITDIVSAMPMAASIDRAAVAARFKSMPQPGKAPAAAAAQPEKEKDMTGQVTPAAGQTQAATEAEIKAAATAALAADQQRRAGIKALKVGAVAKLEGIDAVIDAAVDDINCSIEAAGQRILAHMAKDAAPVAGGYVVTVEDEGDKFRKGVSAALSIRAGLTKNDGSNPFRGHTMYEMARASLERHGVKTSHLDKLGVVAASFTHSTSDFTNLLADVANKSMLKGYEEADETYQKWTSKGTLSDFKVTKRVGLDTFPSLSEVPEGGEYKYATMGDRGESIVLATYGKMFSITRQAVINDDLEAFTKVPRLMGRAAPRTVGNLVYAILTGNPTMSDNVALFHATHKNLLTGAALSTAAIDAMVTAMRKQKDATGSTLNIRLGSIIVPVALEGLALTIANSEYEVNSTRDATTPNYMRGRFEVVSDARLDEASAAVWYGAANPTMFDTVEVSYLDGNEAPVLEQQNGWDIDGVEFKVRLDAGVKALEFRTLAKNPGA